MTPHSDSVWTPGLTVIRANMFYIPLAIFVGTPGLSVGHYIAHSMIPSLLGNIAGGGVSCSCSFVECVR